MSKGVKVGVLNMQRCKLKNNIYIIELKENFEFLMIFFSKTFLGKSKMDKKNVQKSIFQNISPKKHVL